MMTTEGQRCHASQYFASALWPMVIIVWFHHAAMHVNCVVSNDIMVTMLEPDLITSNNYHHHSVNHESR